MPGVDIKVGAVSGSTSPGRSPAGTYFTVGQAERGPTDKAVVLNSFSEFARVFGGPTAYSSLYDSVRTFFEEGGSRAIVRRVVGSAATAGTLSTPLQDKSATPVNTLAVAAVSPGSWSSRVSVLPLAGQTADTFRLQVLVDGRIAEDYNSLRSPQDAVAIINESGRASDYVRLTDLASETVAPDNNPKPLTSAVALTAGTDDRASIDVDDYVAALDAFPAGMGDGAVAIPGLGSTVHEALLAHAAEYNRIALLSSERATEVGTLLSQAAALDAPRGGLFAPWIRIPDASGVGGKVISPEPYVAAARARAVNMSGPWRAAAGDISRANWVLAPDETYTPAESNALDEGKVNAIVTRAGAVRNYGWRSLAVDQVAWQFLSSADLVNRVVVLAQAQLEQYVFAPIDDRGHLLSAMRATLEGIVKPIKDLDGLYPYGTTDDAGTYTELDPGYKVVVDGSLNPRESLASNVIYAHLGLRPAPTAAMVYLTVTKAGVTAPL